MIGMTNYVTVRGEKMIFPGKDGIGFGQITDGTSNTILTLEVSDAAAVVWTKPDDLEPDPMKALRGIVGLRKGGFLAGLADGSVFKISDRIDNESLMLLFLRDDGTPVDPSRFDARQFRAGRVDRPAVEAVPTEKAPPRSGQ
jgi:hypothetical protein